MSRTLGAASCLRSFHQSSQPTARLLCLPHAGGTAGYFFDLSAALSPAIEVLAVQYRSRTVLGVALMGSQAFENRGATLPLAPIELDVHQSARP